MPESLTSEPSLCQTDVLSEFRCRVPPKVMWKMQIAGLHDHDYTPSSWLQDLRARPNNRPCRFLSRQLFSGPKTPSDSRSSSGGESSRSSGTEDTSDDLSTDSDVAGDLSNSLSSYMAAGLGHNTGKLLDGNFSKSLQPIIIESSLASSGHYTSSAASHFGLAGTVDVEQPVAAPSPMSFLDVSTGSVTHDKPHVGPLTNAVLATEFARSSASSIYAWRNRPSDVIMSSPTSRSAYPREKPNRTTVSSFYSLLAPHMDNLQTSSASARNTRINPNVQLEASCQYDTSLAAGTAIRSTNPAYQCHTPRSTVKSTRAAQDRNVASDLSPSGTCDAKGNGSDWQRSVVTGSRSRAATAVDSLDEVEGTESPGHDARATKRRRIQD
ncbi:Hypp4280 [Branchiostoma lanceolatum]|uniref:Hypp4280 protein n=2 Tax=Branchiostoma lanceolatum TaxID=7740 RepID=A0A8K0AC22_BRALA|nr:Hypp4280 [Branchiostoma lanceolatum]